MRLTILFPLACSIAAFVLAILALFAGSKPGYMEDYNVLLVNTSTLGHNLIPTPTSGGSQPSQTSSGIGSFFSSLVHNVSAEIGDELNKIENAVADKLAGVLGISQWYSMHLMDACEGNFAPNVTTPGAWQNVTNCTSPGAGYQLNLSALLDHELKVGPVKLNLADIQFPSGVQKEIDRLNKALLAVFIFFVIGVAFAGLEIVMCLGSLFVGIRRSICLGNFVVTSIAAISLVIGDIITTVVAYQGSETLNDIGNDVGLSANPGGKFVAISWAAFALMAVATVYWMGEFFLDHRAKKRVWTEKVHTRRGS